MSDDKTTVDFTNDTFYKESHSGFSLFKRRMTYNDIFSKIKKYCSSEPQNILEIGSGSGFFLKFFAEKYKSAQVTGIEYDDRLHETIKGNAPNATVLKGNAEKLDLPHKYDLIVSTHVIEHLFNPELMIDGAYKHLASDGVFIVTTPNIDSLGYKIHQNNWNGIREDHVSLMNLTQLCELLEGYEFEIEYAGSTMLSGIKIMRIFPFRLLNDFLLIIFGSCKWKFGEALIVVAKPK